MRALGHTLVLGAGYTGRRLCDHLENHDVELGMQGLVRTRTVQEAGCISLDLSQQSSIQAFCEKQEYPFETCFVTISPAKAPTLLESLNYLTRHAVISSARLIGIVSTATYGDVSGQVNEATPPNRRTERHQTWGAYDDGLLALSGNQLDVCVVRTPAIYGPGRDHRKKLLEGTHRVIQTNACTSRIHVDDLVSILIAVATSKELHPCVLATDNAPAPTHEVVKYAARLLGTPPPRILSLEEAQAEMTERQRSMWMQNRQCVSLHLEELGVKLMYPTYREGLAHLAE